MQALKSSLYYTSTRYIKIFLVSLSHLCTVRCQRLVSIVSKQTSGCFFKKKKIPSLQCQASQTTVCLSLTYRVAVVCCDGESSQLCCAVPFRRGGITSCDTQLESLAMK